MELLGTEVSKYLNKDYLEKFKYLYDRLCAWIDITAAEYKPHSPQDIRIIELAKKLDYEYTKIRYRLYHDDKKLEEAIGWWEITKKEFADLKPQNPELHNAVSSIVHYQGRKEMDSAIRWPINYLDVFPVVYENMSGLMMEIRARNNKCAEINRPMPPPQVDMRGVDTYYISLPYKKCTDSANARAECTVKRFINTITANILTRLGGKRRAESATIKFVFTNDRVIQPRAGAPGIEQGHLHPFDLYYQYLGWDKCEKDIRLARVQHRVARWIVYDIFFHVIMDTTRDLVIYFADDHIGAISFLLVNLGKRLCQDNVQFEFQEYTELPAQPPRGRFMIEWGKTPRADIGAAQAFYFIYYHEVYRANYKIGSASPPTLMTNVGDGLLPPVIGLENIKYSLFKKLVAAKDAVAAYVASLSFRKCTEDEFAAAMQRLRDMKLKNALAQLDKMKAEGKTPPKPTITLVEASPGTGKSSFLRTLRDIPSIDIDHCSEIINIDGFKFDFINYHRDKINSIIGSFGLPFRQRELLSVTLWNDHRGKFTEQYYIAGRRIMPTFIRECIAAKISLMVEDFGLQSAVYKETDFAASMDQCGTPTKISAESTFYEDFCGDASCELVLLYIHPIRQYNQQLLRFLAEHRLRRYYQNMRTLMMNWGDVQKQWHGNFKIYGIGDGEIYLFYDGDVLWDNVQKYVSERNMIDEHFAEHLLKLASKPPNFELIINTYLSVWDFKNLPGLLAQYRK